MEYAGLCSSFRKALFFWCYNFVKLTPTGTVFLELDHHLHGSPLYIYCSADRSWSTEYFWMLTVGRFLKPLVLCVAQLQQGTGDEGDR